jgi:hypothetical protein
LKSHEEPSYTELTWEQLFEKTVPESERANYGKEFELQLRRKAVARVMAHAEDLWDPPHFLDEKYWELLELDKAGLTRDLVDNAQLLDPGEVMEWKRRWSESPRRYPDPIDFSKWTDTPSDMRLRAAFLQEIAYYVRRTDPTWAKKIAIDALAMSFRADCLEWGMQIPAEKNDFPRARR